jgi:peptide/nickel transport system permease protein
MAIQTIRRYLPPGRKGKLALLALVILCAVALMADLLSSSAPLYARYKGKTLYPAFYLAFHRDFLDSVPDSHGGYLALQYTITDWRALPLEAAAWPLIPYSSSFIDPYNRDFRSPLGPQEYKNSSGEIVAISPRFRHWLGTDKIGRDVAAGIVHGARVAILIGVGSMLLAALIGISLGAWAGLSGFHSRTSTPAEIPAAIAGSLLGWFYGFHVRRFTLQDAREDGLWPFLLQFLISIFIFLLFIRLLRRLAAWMFKKQGRGGSAEAWAIMRLTEITDSIPSLLLLIVAGSLFKEKGAALMILLIGLTSWTVIARLTRAETLRISTLGYIEAARALGYSRVHIIMRHVLPNALGPARVAIAFGMAGAILLESSLSFLGIGLPPDVVSWGGMLGEVREGISAWWMTVFPGLAILITLLTFHALGEAWQQRR